MSKNIINGHQIDLGTNSYDDSLTLPYWTIQGETEGPHVYLQASMHGSELQGNAVLFELIKYFETHPLRGKITIVPRCNPYGLSSQILGKTLGRFNLFNGHNFNRYYPNLEKLSDFSPKDFYNKSKNLSPNESKKQYKSYLKDLVSQATSEESQEKVVMLATKLWLLAIEADIVLDLHTGACATDYVYSSEHLFDKAKDLNFPFIIKIPNEFAGALDEATFMPWYRLQECGGPSFFESYTLELGGEDQLSTPMAQKQLARLLGYFSMRGLVDCDLPTKKGQWFAPLVDYKSFYSPRSGLFEFVVGPGEFFKAGEPLGHFYNFKTRQKESFSINFDGVVINHASSSNIQKGDLLFQVFDSPKKV